MNIIDIIKKKRDKKELTKEEIDYVIKEFVNGNIKDYQMSSLLMAININGMTFDETYNLTISMLNSGNILDLSLIDGIKVDKHSTGGVGDKTTLVVAPLVASCDVKVIKMSGRGLGFTGGTIDKLESIPNFKVNLSKEEFISEENSINMAIISQTDNIATADKKIYALRDVTGTEESIPLIASSIMSKKLALNVDKIVIDVKVGKGAFIKNIDDASKLSEIMIKIGKRCNKEVVCLITNMDYPLGYTVGNSLEVLEAIDTLNCKGEENFTKLCLILSSYMVSISKNISIDDALEEVKENLYNGNAYNKFKEFVKYQNGDINGIKVDDNYVDIHSSSAGYITDIDTLKLASLVSNLGAGRKEKDDVINPMVGVKLFRHINDIVKENDLLMRVYTSSKININDYLDLITISESKLNNYKIIYKIMK